MSNNTHRLASVDRVATLIETYGSNTHSWPKQERAAALAVLRDSTSLQALYTQAEDIDTVILADAGTSLQDEALLARIVDELPEQVPHRRRWLLPASLAASIAAVLLVLSSWSGNESIPQVETMAVNDMDYWLWQDVTGQVTFDSSEDVALDFMELLEPDAG
ncbi:MAG: hypothetical protein PVF75_03635 [Granulosicoccaceae bacterium]|jgi:hypothetical protein